MRLAAVLGAVLPAGCTSSAPAGPPLVVEGSPVASPYDGPMSLPISFYGERGYFGPNLERVRDSAEQVLAQQVGFPTPVTLPPSGYRLERVDQGCA